MPKQSPPEDGFVNPTRGASEGWRSSRTSHSLPEAFASIPIPGGKSFWRKFFAFAGPGYLVAVGYMDPGNWATDLAAGARYGYALLSVVLISNLMAILLQGFALKLGIVTGRDLAQACRDHFPRGINLVLWFLCEVAIAACDLAEVIGSAIALNLLFGLPLVWGVILTALDVLLILMLQKRGFRRLEAIVVVLLTTVAVCFGIELILVRPDAGGILRGFVPTSTILTDPEMLYLALGILGATVMPHNLYLHSSVVQTRKIADTIEAKREAIRYGMLDTVVALSFAFFVNAAILILASATFHGTVHEYVADIHDAHQLLTPLLGTTMAGALFAVALLASGQNSTITGTMAGQIVMEGFLDLRIPSWLRRLITRLVAIVPAVITAIFYGEHGIAELLVLSQVILSVQLSFAVIPLVWFTSSRSKMGSFVNSKLTATMGWTVAVVIAALNLYLLVAAVEG